MTDAEPDCAASLVAAGEELGRRARAIWQISAQTAATARAPARLARHLGRYATEPTFAQFELAQGADELRLGEVRPHTPREIELGVCALPEQEVAEPLLASAADE